MSVAAVLAGLGAAVPPRVVTNDELSQRLDTTDDWIRSRTGVQERHWVEPGVATSDLAVQAGARALAAAGGVPPDMLVLSTTTPDHPCPATGPDVAARLELGPIASFDIGATCSGFIYALAVASASISAGLARRVLVISAEVFSTVLNPDDRTTSVILGDGAGAAVVRAGDAGEPGALLDFDLGSDGRLRDLILIPSGGSRERGAEEDPEPADRYFMMHGKQVFTHAVTRMAESAQTVLSRVGWGLEVDWFVPHQANLRILYSVADKLGLDRDRVVVDLDRVGNTSAASIPLALSQAACEGRIRPGDRVLLSAFGGGATWGSTAVVWPDMPVRKEGADVDEG